MSEQSGKEGPALAGSVAEVQGWFPSDAALQEALSKLTLAGYDRADFSLPEDHPAVATPTESADNPVDSIDKQQVRTLTSGMAAAGAGMAVAGVVLTGGVALAAAAAGLGAAAIASGTGVAVDGTQIQHRNDLGAAGHLVLAVRTDKPGQADQAEAIMRETGATHTSKVTRADTALTAGVSAASWTG